jgi:O-antigen/teichoic acid export membrane protein
MKGQPFTRHFLVLLSGTATSQLILVAITPILTRLYSPDSFGLIAILTGILSVLTVLSSLRYAQALAIVNSDLERNNILLLCNGITIINFALSVILIRMFGQSILDWFDISVDPVIMWLVPIGFLFAGAQNTYRLLHIGRRNFQIIAISQITKTMVTVILQLSLFTFGEVGISIGYILGFGFAALVMLVPVLRVAVLSPEWSLVGILKAAYRYKDFPIYSSWAGLINNINQYLPYFIFPFYFGVVGTGLFLLAHRMTFAPVSMLIKTTADVLMPYAAEAHHEGRLDALVLRTIATLTAIASIPCVLIAVVSPYIFPMLFGSEWALSGELAKYIAIAVFFNTIGNPISRLIPILERQGVGLGFNIIMFIVRSVAIFMGAMQNSIVLATLYFSVSSAIVWCGYILIIAHLSGASWIRAIMLMIRFILFPVVAFVPYWFAVFFSNGDQLTYAFMGFGFIVVTAYGLYATRQGFIKS